MACTSCGLLNAEDGIAGRDETGRVLTGTVLERDDQAQSGVGPLEVVGETPWGALMACPNAVRDHLARFAPDGQWETTGLFVVDDEALPTSSVVVAAPWVPDAREPIAAWFTLHGTSVGSYRSCSSWFHAPPD